MSVAEILILGLAVNQVVEVWHHSTLFAKSRQKLELLREDPSLLKYRWLAKPVEMLTCPWCFSVWAALLVILAWYTPFWFLDLILAVSRLANLVNDAFKAIRDRRK